MKVLVCGGRDYTDYGKMKEILDAFSITEIIHGGARGADSLAGRYGRENGKPVIEFPADWRTFGRSAGPIRNRRMLEEGLPEMVIAFPGGSGTENMIKQAREAGVPVRIAFKRPEKPAGEF